MLALALRLIGALNRGICIAVGALAGILILSIMVGGVADVVSRWLFDRPLQGTFELTQVALMASVFLGFAYAELHGHHITVDLLYERLPTLGQRAVDLLAGACKLTVVLTLTWQLVQYQQVLDAANRTTPVLRLPQDTILWAAIIGSSAFAFAILAGTIMRFTRPHSVDSPAQIGVV